MEGHISYVRALLSLAAILTALLSFLAYHGVLFARQQGNHSQGPTQNSYRPLMPGTAVGVGAHMMVETC